MMDRKTLIASITHGDINSISYEIIIKALTDSDVTSLCVPVIYGSPKVAAYHRKVINATGFNFNNARSVSDVQDGKVNLINCIDDDVRVELGKSTPEGGQASLAALEAAVDDLLAGRSDLLVTAPVDKHTLQSDKLTFTGHTGYLRNRFGVDDVLMLMISDSLKVGFVTEHLALRDVSAALSADSILSKLKLLNSSLIQDFALRGPRIGVLSLNPHAGEKGLLGNEEQEIIIPAISRANEEGILAFGPYPADGLFGSGAFSRFDAILAMYHDQGMTPFKAITFDTGVNYTAGLPVVRTSPVHGTAFDIAGKNEASGNSMRHAIYAAIDIYRNREMYKELTRNPLQPQKVEIHPDHSDELPPESDNYYPGI